MMRYLLLSVLVVCVIGIMIPSVFAEEPCYGGPVENIPPGGLPCFSPYMDDPPTPEERCKMKDECMIKVTTDKQIYQSDETIKIFTLYKPTTFEEFRTQVPLQSRQQINGEEAQSYLWEVLEIIKTAA